MKAISIWQPYASLAAHGFKTHETRSWPAPKSLIGKRFGIASTKTVKPDQRTAFNEPSFQEFYSKLPLPQKFEELPLGALLGTVVLDSVELITEELLEDISDEEQQYGWHQVGYYIWRLVDPEPLFTPIIIRGSQGIYDINGDIEAQISEDAEADASLQERPADIRRHLRVI